MQRISPWLTDTEQEVLAYVAENSNLSEWLQDEQDVLAATDGSYPFAPRKLESDPLGVNLPAHVGSSQVGREAQKYQRTAVSLPPTFLRRVSAELDEEVTKYERSLAGLGGMSNER
jgi:hypothetical protein